MSDYENELDSSFEADKKYTIELTDYLGRKLKKIGFNIYEFFTDDSTLIAFFDRSEVFSDALVLMCEPQDEDAFLKSLNGKVLEDARKAVQNAIVNFSPVQTRQSVCESFSSMTEIMRKAMDEQLELPKQ